MTGHFFFFCIHKRSDSDRTILPIISPVQYNNMDTQSATIYISTPHLIIIIYNISRKCSKNVGILSQANNVLFNFIILLCSTIISRLKINQVPIPVYFIYIRINRQTIFHERFFVPFPQQFTDNLQPRDPHIPIGNIETILNCDLFSFFILCVFRKRFPLNI